MSTLAARFDDLRALLHEAGRVIVAGHTRADGDAVGAVAALRRHLELQDRSVTALLLEPLSPRYAFMDFARRYEVYEPARHDALVRGADAFIMCDLSSLSRLGPLGELVASAGCRTVCIDHHPCEGEGPADINLLDPAATATGRIVWDYIRHVGGRVDHEIAESVFVSLCTDTGWFRYANTDEAVLKLAGELAGHRLDVPGIHRAIYQSSTTAMLRLLGHVTRGVHEECEGRFLWFVIRHALVAELGVERLDADPILDVLRSSAAVEAVALFTEQPDGSLSVSLRGRAGLDVNAVARDFGGGGHVQAAGTTLPAATAEADRAALVAAIRRRLRAA